MKPDQALIKLDVARKALAAAMHIPDVKKIRDQLATIEHYMRRQQYSKEAIGDASELKIRAERRLGDLIKKTVGPGKPKLFHDETISRKRKLPKGISRLQAHRWRLVAAVSEKQFEKHVQSVRKQQEDLTTSGVVRIARRTDRVKRIQTITDNAPVNVDEQPVPVLYADPPWRYEHVKTDNRAIENQYPTLNLEDICTFKIGAVTVADLATPDAVLFLWATSPKLFEAFSVLQAWSFTYRTSMVWVKDKIGMGYYARQQHEFLLIATRGDLPVPLAENRPASVVTAPRTKHSRKPEIFYELIERMYPEFERRELFQRGKPRKGWRQGVGYESQAAS